MATTETPAGIAAGQEAQGAPSDAAPLTDEQIVGLEPGSEAQVEGVGAKPEAPSGEAAEPSALAAEEPGTEEAPKDEIPQDGRTIPAELREVFKANPKLRDAWFSERAYRDVFPTVREARELKEIFPGGVEDAKLYRDGADTLHHLDGLFIAKTPEAHEQLRKELGELDPEANKELAWGYAHDLVRIDPEGFKEAMAGAFAERLPEWAAREGLPTHSQLLLQALEGGETEQALGLARQLVAWTSRIGQAQKTEPAKSPDPEVERLKAEIAARDERARQQADESLRSDVTNRYVAEVKGFLEKSVPTASEKARTKMVGEIMNAINRQLADSPAFMAQLNQLKAAGQISEAANFVIGRAKQLLPQVGRRILNEWTSEILAANKTTVAKKAAAAQARDVGAGPAPATSGSKPVKVDYGKLSDTDILNS